MPFGLDDLIGEQIRCAADILRERGWCQGKFKDHRGRVCTLGALALAQGGKMGLWGPKFGSIPAPVLARLVKAAPVGFPNFSPSAEVTVCAINNWVKNKTELFAWLERAMAWPK